MEKTRVSFGKLLKRLLVVFAAFFIVLSPIVIIEEAHHECSHEDCQICEVIREAENNIKHTIKFNNDAHIALLIAVSFAIVFCLLAICIDKEFNTPITLKTKLSI